MPLRLGALVRCPDGKVGELGGGVIDPWQRRVTHLLVDYGHLGGKQEPIEAVHWIDNDELVLSLSNEKAGR